MNEQLPHTFMAGLIAVGALLVSPLIVPDAFRAESFEACFESPDLKSKLFGQKSRVMVAAHKNLSPNSLDIYWADFNGKWKFHKKMPAGTGITLETFLGHQWVARVGNSCEYFSSYKNVQMEFIGEHMD